MATWAIDDDSSVSLALAKLAKPRSFDSDRHAVAHDDGVATFVIWAVPNLVGTAYSFTASRCWLGT